MMSDELMEILFVNNGFRHTVRIVSTIIEVLPIHLDMLLFGGNPHQVVFCSTSGSNFMGRCTVDKHASKREDITRLSSPRSRRPARMERCEFFEKTGLALS